MFFMTPPNHPSQHTRPITINFMFQFIHNAFNPSTSDQKGPVSILDQSQSTLCFNLSTMHSTRPRRIKKVQSAYSTNHAQALMSVYPQYFEPVHVG